MFFRKSSTGGVWNSWSCPLNQACLYSCQCTFLLQLHDQILPDWSHIYAKLLWLQQVEWQSIFEGTMGDTPQLLHAVRPTLPDREIDGGNFNFENKLGKKGWTNYFDLLSVCIQNMIGKGWIRKAQGGHSNYGAVHMHDQRNTKKGLFFEAKCDSHESRLGVKMCLFLRKRVLLDSIKVC